MIRTEMAWAVSINNPTPIETCNNISNRTNKSWVKHKNCKLELLLHKGITNNSQLQAEEMVD